MRFMLCAGALPWLPRLRVCRQPRPRRLQGQDDHHHHQHRGRRHLRPLRASHCAPHAEAILPGNPTMVVQNMPGAGNVLATNFLYNIAPKDGTTIAYPPQCHPAAPGARRQGRALRRHASSIGWAHRPGEFGDPRLAHRRRQDRSRIFRPKEVILGGTGAGSGIVIFPTMMNNMLGHQVQDRDGLQELGRGQYRHGARRGAGAQLQPGVGEAAPDWLDDKKIDFIAQIGVKRASACPTCRCCRNSPPPMSSARSSG